MNQQEVIHGELAVLADRLCTHNPDMVAEVVRRLRQLAAKGQAGGAYRCLVDALSDIATGATCPDPDDLDDVVAWRATVHQLRAIAADVVSLLPIEMNDLAFQAKCFNRAKGVSIEPREEPVSMGPRASPLDRRSLTPGITPPKEFQ